MLRVILSLARECVANRKGKYKGGSAYHWILRWTVVLSNDMLVLEKQLPVELATAPGRVLAQEEVGLVFWILCWPWVPLVASAAEQVAWDTGVKLRLQQTSLVLMRWNP